MKNIILGLTLLCAQLCSVAQTENDCHQKTQSASDIKKIEPVMCIPAGYHIVDIYEEDLNGDGRIDKVTEWFKEALHNGDTIFHSVYFQLADSTFSHFATYGNLSSVYFDLKSQSPEVVLEDSRLNEIKNMYSYHGWLPTFHKKGFVVQFYTDAAGYKKLFFKFSSEKRDFVLIKEQDWLAPRSATWTEGEHLEDETTYLEQEGMLAKKFNVLEYLE